METSDLDETSIKKSSIAGKRPMGFADSSRKHMEQQKGRAYAVTGEVNFMQEEDLRLETTRARLSNVLSRHESLVKVLSRDSDKIIFDRLQKEFEMARTLQTEEIRLDGDQWNDGLLATIRQRVHMEAERKAMPEDSSMAPDSHFQGKITYTVGSKTIDTLRLCYWENRKFGLWLTPPIDASWFNPSGSVASSFENRVDRISYYIPCSYPLLFLEVICCLEGARIGILYETSFAGEPCEFYHCVLESKSFLEKMTVIEHTVPFYLPIREAENDLLSSNAMKFIDYVGELVQAYTDRHQQVRLIKELYGNQISELYHSLSFHVIEFVLHDSDCKVTVSLRYADLVSTLPTRIRVLAWPVHSKSLSSENVNRKGSGTPVSQLIPARLSYAEDALRTMSLPQAYAEIVLNLPQALREIFQQSESS